MFILIIINLIFLFYLFVLFYFYLNKLKRKIYACILKVLLNYNFINCLSSLSVNTEEH